MTHSICTLEFADHRPLYDWLIENLPVPSRPAPVRVRAAEPHVHGAVEARAAAPRRGGPRPRLGRPADADDVRACAGAATRPRRSASSPRRSACRKARLASSTSASLEHAVREVLNRTAPRRLAVLRPLKVVIEDYPEGQVEMLEAPNNPEDPSAGTRQVPFSRELWIERDDFMEEPPQAVLPTRARPGGAAPLRVLHHLPRGRQGRVGRGGRAALHVRPRDPWRRCARRPPPEGHAALALGGPRRRRPRCGCTTTCSRDRTRAPRAT